MSMRAHRSKNFRSKRRLARRREVDSSDIYRYNPYDNISYSSTVRGRKPNRRMNGRPQGVCGSCSKRRR